MTTIAPWGKPGKAGKQAGPVTVQGSPHGPESGSSVIPAPNFRHGDNPIARSYAARLGVASALNSPMVAGRFRPQDKSNPPRRADANTSFGAPDLGALQNFRGSFQGPQTVRLGAQAGPSQQPAFPNTNNDSSVDFSGLDLPDVWRVKRL